MNSNVVCFTSPVGRGRCVAPGEGLRSIDRPYPLTPTLSPWERGRTVVVATSVAEQVSAMGERR
jgi:hypothetical protein